MFKGASDKQSFIRRTGSHATRQSARGIIWDVPRWAEPVVAPDPIPIAPVPLVADFVNKHERKSSSAIGLKTLLRRAEKERNGEIDATKKEMASRKVMALLKRMKEEERKRENARRETERLITSLSNVQAS